MYVRRLKGINLKFMWNVSNIELWMWNQVSYDPHSCKSNSWICIYRSLQKVRTLTGFELMTSCYPCNALTNWAMKPLTLGAGDLLVTLVICWWCWELVICKERVRNKFEVIIWNISYIQLRMWNQVSYDPRSYESNLCNWVYRSLQKVRTLKGLNLWPCDNGAML